MVSRLHAPQSPMVLLDKVVSVSALAFLSKCLPSGHLVFDILPPPPTLPLFVFVLGRSLYESILSLVHVGWWYNLQECCPTRKE